MAASAQSLRVTSAGALQRLWRSSLGKKYVMAITGFGLWIFVIVHMLGNLQIFLGPEKIKFKKPVASTFANRTMWISGLIIFAFILFHLAHFTFGWVDPEFLHMEDAAGRHDVYRMMITGFSNPVVSIFYIVSMGLLLSHLSHGVSSLFQSLGLRSKKTFGFFDKLAKISALALFIGNSLIPLAVMFRFVR